jgi:transposase
MDKDVRIQQLESENTALRKRIAELEAKIASLSKNSSNSSKPPSSDITKPPNLGGGGGRSKRFKKRKPESRRIDPAPFPEERVDRSYDYFFEAPGALVALDEYRSFQQVELIDNPFRITEHRCRVYLDLVTGNKVLASLPPEIRRGGLLGPRLTAWIGYLKSVSNCSYTQIGAMLEEVFDLPISRGLLAKAVRKTGDATAQIYDQLCARLPNEPRLNIDETGHQDRGTLMWTWCFRSPKLTVYRISPSRGSQVLTEMLGESFGGVIGSDCFSAYLKYAGSTNVELQLCLAHLIRDARYLTTLPAPWTRRFGEKLLNVLTRVFRLYHRRDELGARVYRRRMDTLREELVRKARAARCGGEAATLAKRIVKQASRWFTFVKHAEVEPTNNLAERALRPIVIARKLTQGTRGPRGQRQAERLWTVIETARQQNVPVFAFLARALDAHLRKTVAPVLLV